MTIFKFFLDVTPGLDVTTTGYLATTKPGIKADTCKRISFDIEVPDDVLFDTDYHVDSSKSRRNIKVKRKKKEARNPNDLPIHEAE